MAEKEIVKTAPWLYTVLEDGSVHLSARKCKDCGEVFYPVQDHCTNCFSDELEEYILPSEGEIYSICEVVRGPQGFAGPYFLGHCDIEQFRIFGNIWGANGEEPKIGDKVVVKEGVIREDEEHQYVSYIYQVVKGDK